MIDKPRYRKTTRQVRAGSLLIGGEAPVSIQSMTNLPVEMVDETVGQINRLRAQGAELVRVALRGVDSVASLKRVVNSVDVPICADVHFDYRIAVAAIEAGANKVRINPGNIGSARKVIEVVKAAREHSVPIRIGVNSGSVDRKRYPEVTPESLVASAMEEVRLLEDNDFSDIVVSIKSSDIGQTVEANRIFSGMRNYPIHLGLTEAGYGMTCIVQSSVAIGHILMDGIGDTIRVSMTGDPVEEVLVAGKILEAVGERRPRVRIISCPTCGRTDPSVDLLELAREVDREVTSRFASALTEMDRHITVAVMGCEVNGPGEASHADAGIAGVNDGTFVLFANGKKKKRVHRHDAVAALINEIEGML